MIFFKRELLDLLVKLILGFPVLIELIIIYNKFLWKKKKKKIYKNN